MPSDQSKPAPVERPWYVVDAAGQTLGRLASRIAHVLRGKHRPEFVPHADTGGFVVVTNAERVAVTGRKETDKLYRRHSGHPGGFREQTLGVVRATHPERILRAAVWGMLPHNALGRRVFRKLKVYAGSEHPHVAQKPQPLP
jgi:large subunit ribosomal protein L13